MLKHTIFLIFLCFSPVLAQSPPAQAPAAQPPAATQPPTTTQPPAAAQPPTTTQPPVQAPSLNQPLVQGPAPPGPTNITRILEKAGHFTTLIRLLKSTQLNTEIYNRLNDSSQGLTMFAPTDAAFGKLTTGTLNSYSDHQKFQLVKFHLISSFLAPAAFQTVSNPMATEAGSPVDYPLNVTVGNQLVNISTGIVNTTVSGTIYSDNQLAVYQLDSVLLPMYFFKPPAPAPAPAKPVKGAPLSPSGSLTTTPDDDSSVKSSGAMRGIRVLNAMSFFGFIVAGLSLCV